MTDFFLKKGDTNNDLVRIVSDDVGALTLSGATARFQMRPKNTQVTKVDAPAVIDLATTGKVVYSWQDADVDTPGEFVGEFKITFANGKKATFPNGDDYIEILIGSGVDDEP